MDATAGKTAWFVFTFFIFNFFLYFAKVYIFPEILLEKQQTENATANHLYFEYGKQYKTIFPPKQSITTTN